MATTAAVVTICPGVYAGVVAYGAINPAAYRAGTADAGLGGATGVSAGATVPPAGGCVHADTVAQGLSSRTFAFSVGAGIPACTGITAGSAVIDVVHQVFAEKTAVAIWREALALTVLAGGH